MSLIKGQSTIVRQFDISKIKIAKGREADPERVAKLVQSIKESTLIHPVGVNRGELVWGLHRLKACEALGWEKIPGIDLDLDKPSADLARIDENLIRHELTALERGKLTAERKTVYEKLHPETKAGTAGGVASGKARSGEQAAHSPLVHPASSFTKDTAEKTGQSKTSVERDAKIGTIDAQAAKTITGTPTADSKAQLLDLARLPPEQQRKIAKIVKGGKAKSVGDAIGKKPHKPATRTAEDAEEVAAAKGEILRLNEALDQAHDKIKVLSTGDTKAELAKQVDRYERLSGRLAGAMTTANEAQRQATAYGRILTTLCKILKVDGYGEIVEAVRDLKR